MDEQNQRTLTDLRNVDADSIGLDEPEGHAGQIGIPDGALARVPGWSPPSEHR